MQSEDSVDEGALKWGEKRLTGIVQTSGSANMNADPRLDLSRGNSIFGASDTVQPAGMYGLYLVRAYEV